MPLASIKLRPVLGLRTNVPHNDPSLFNGDACHCVDMLNVDFNRTRNSANKSTGRTQYSAAANAQATRCLGLMELKGSSVTEHLMWDNGKFYYVNASREFTNVDASAPVTFGQTNNALICAIQYGDYVLFTDRSRTLTPYKWKTGDANLTKLILSGTEYKFSYLEKFQRRIIGAYSDQTNGDVEIRWTDPLPTWASLSFAVANQLYKPGNDSITGIKTFGSNSCFLYGSDSIDSIDYYANYTTPFAIRNMVNNHGCAGHHSIVDTGATHFFFNKHYGFVAYQGGATFPGGGRPISESIENVISGINPLYYHLIVGTFVPQTNEVAWAVPLTGGSTNSHILYYDIVRGQWRKKEIVAYYLDYWTLDTALIWNDLTALGYTDWEDFGTMLWTDLVSSNPGLVTAATNGHVYTDTGESNAGSAWDGYRIEPAVSVDGINKSVLEEIWFGVHATGSFNLYVHYRGGNSVAECESAAWETLPEVSCNNPRTAVCYTSKFNKYHQIKWGTDSASEAFSINEIEYKMTKEGLH